MAKKPTLALTYDKNWVPLSLRPGAPRLATFETRVYRSSSNSGTDGSSMNRVTRFRPPLRQHAHFRSQKNGKKRDLLSAFSITFSHPNCTRFFQQKCETQHEYRVFAHFSRFSKN